MRQMRRVLSRLPEAISPVCPTQVSAVTFSAWPSSVATQSPLANRFQLRGRPWQRSAHCAEFRLRGTALGAPPSGHRSRGTAWQQKSTGGGGSRHWLRLAEGAAGRTPHARGAGRGGAPAAGRQRSASGGGCRRAAAAAAEFARCGAGDARKGVSGAGGCAGAAQEAWRAARKCAGGVWECGNAGLRECAERARRTA